MVCLKGSRMGKRRARNEGERRGREREKREKDSEREKAREKRNILTWSPLVRDCHQAHVPDATVRNKKKREKKGRGTRAGQSHDLRAHRDPSLFLEALFHPFV